MEEVSPSMVLEASNGTGKQDPHDGHVLATLVEREEA